MIRQVGTAVRMTFQGPAAARGLAIFLGLGTAATAFYLVMLPSSAVGGFSLVALHYLTPTLAVAAGVLGYGFALAIAINVGALRGRSRAAEAVGAGSLFASILPGSLCCTSIVPAILATLGASVPTVLGTTGKIQSIFALHEGAFILASIAGVILSIFLAAYNRTAACSI